MRKVVQNVTPVDTLSVKRVRIALMGIYTKTGDKGETSLYHSKDPRKRRVSKASAIIEAIGAVDELNSYLGVTLASSRDEKLNQVLENVQGDLLTVGSIIAGSKLRFHASKTKRIEKQIDGLEKKLPRLRNFILPGGSTLSSNLHYCRALTRRAERHVVLLSRVTSLSPNILTYINRLSDFFFVLARKSAKDAGVSEKTWKSGS